MVNEKPVDRLGEQFRHAQRQREARIIFVGFDRVDGLTGNAEPPGKLALAPASPFAKQLDPILHPTRMCKELLSVKTSLQLDAFHAPVCFWSLHLRVRSIKRKGWSARPP